MTKVNEAFPLKYNNILECKESSRETDWEDVLPKIKKKHKNEIKDPDIANNRHHRLSMDYSYNFCIPNNKFYKRDNHMKGLRESDPIISYGIILFHVIDEAKDAEYLNSIDNNKCDNPLKHGDLLFLIAQRRHTISFVDFVSGKLPDNDRDMIRYISMMSYDEKRLLIEYKNCFDKLWNIIFTNKNFVRDKERASILFIKNNSKYFKNYLSDLKTVVNDKPWGFPKGRMKKEECGIECAKREFNEETDLDFNKYKICVYNISWTDDYVGTDGKYYRNIFYPAKCEVITKIEPTAHAYDNYITPEIGKIEWVKIDQSKGKLTDRQIEILKIVEHNIGQS
jgi:8-oxo-dGTP pyrophosphatase MutT (NUDIX family)